MDIAKDQAKKTFTLKQNGLIDKMISTLKMDDCNGKLIPALKTPLGADLNGDPF